MGGEGGWGVLGEGSGRVKWGLGIPPGGKGGGVERMAAKPSLRGERPL